MSHLGSEAVYNSSRVCNLQLLVLEVFLDTIRMISVNIVVLILRIIMYSKLQTCSKLIIITEERQSYIDYKENLARTFILPLLVQEFQWLRITSPPSSLLKKIYWNTFSSSGL